MTSGNGRSIWLILIGLTLAGSVIVLYGIVSTRVNNPAENTTASQQHGDGDVTSGSESNTVTAEEQAPEAETTENAVIDEDLGFIDDEVLAHASHYAGKTIFEKENSDPRKFVSSSGITGCLAS